MGEGGLSPPASLHLHNPKNPTYLYKQLMVLLVAKYSVGYAGCKIGWWRIFPLELLHEVKADDGGHHDDQTDREHDCLHQAHRDTSRETPWIWNTTEQVLALQN